MNCETVRKLSQDYLERRLAQLDRHEFLRHVDECSSCERELVGYRDVFTFLGTMRAMEPPRGFQNAVVSRLKSEGLIHRPRVSPLRRWADAFLSLPGPAKYPLAAIVVVAALYVPLKVAFSRAGGAAGKVVVLAADWLVSAADAMREVSFFTRFWDLLGDYARASATVLGALAKVLPSGTGWLLGGGAVVALSAILLVTRVLRKRSSHNAPLCL